MDKKLFRSILWIITYAVLLVLCIVRLDAILALLANLTGLLRPLFVGFAIAFVLRRPCQMFNRLYDMGLGKTKAKKLSRPLAVVTSYLVLILLLAAFVALVLPKLVESIQIFISSLGVYMVNVQTWLNQQGWISGILDMFNLDTLDLSKFSDLIRGALNGVLNTITTAVPQLVTFTGNLISIVITAFLSIIFSVYMLFGDEKLHGQCRRVVKAYLPPKVGTWLTEVAVLTGNTFAAFVNGQLTEACILGGLTGIGMLFIQADYAPLVGMIIAGTALIPMVGAFVGGAIAAALLVIVSPIKALIFIIFLLCLQQFEGNVIYPKVVGSNIGLPAIWVLGAVTVGGGLLGFVGILISVPIASVLYTLLRRDIHRRLDEKN